jgi:hypothetical protein
MAVFMCSWYGEGYESGGDAERRKWRIDPGQSAIEVISSQWVIIYETSLAQAIDLLPA